MPEVWDKMPEESENAFRAFENYLYGEIPRKLPAARTVPGRKKWPRQFSWVERAEAWDADIAKRRKAATTVAIQEQSSRMVLNAEEILNTELDQAFLDPAEIFLWDEQGNFTMKPAEQIPKHLRRVMFSKVKVKQNALTGNLTASFELAGAQARHKALSLLGENQSLWRKKPGESSENFEADFSSFLKMVTSGQLKPLAEWASKYLEKPTEVQFRDIPDAEVVKDDYPEDETRLIPKK